MASHIGIDIGGSSIKAARVGAGGELVSERLSVPTPPGAGPEAVAGAVAELARQLGGGPLGIAFPGVVVGGRTLTAANVSRAWLGLDAAALFSEACGAPAALLNDADAAALAEAHYGAARGEGGTALVLTFGTGIGSGLLRGGVLVPNTELGHLWLRRGQEAEHWAAARVKTEAGLSWPAWAERASEVLAELEALLWPDLLVIGGGLSADSAEWLPLLRSRAPVRAAELGNDAGIIGAALWAAQGR